MVGFGDYYPQTYTGMIIVAITTLIGLAIMKTFVDAVANYTVVKGDAAVLLLQQIQVQTNGLNALNQRIRKFARMDEEDEEDEEDEDHDGAARLRLNTPGGAAVVPLPEPRGRPRSGAGKEA